MNYKTIVMEMLEHRPQLYEALRKDRKLLTAIDLLAMELKASHESLNRQLQQIRPESDARQIFSEAFETALIYLEDRLPPLSSMDEPEELSLDQAMAYIQARPQK